MTQAHAKPNPILVVVSFLEGNEQSMSVKTAPVELLLRKLSLLVKLEPDDVDALHALPIKLEEVTSHRLLVREGDTVTNCCLLVDGYACRNKIARTGKRQIVAFHMPVDMLDLQHSLLPKADHNLQMITDGVVAWILIPALQATVSRHSKIAEAFGKDVLIDASIFREWVLNVGSRDAKTRVAHMLCEFIARREAVGISPIEAMELPMTQEQIGDATGLTAVHVNRMLRILSEEGAFAREGRDYLILDWPKLKKIADFSPTYLHSAA